MYDRVEQRCRFIAHTSSFHCQLANTYVPPFPKAVSDEWRDHCHVQRHVYDVRADGSACCFPGDGKPLRNDLHGT